MRAAFVFLRVIVRNFAVAAARLTNFLVAHLFAGLVGPLREVSFNWNFNYIALAHFGAVLRPHWLLRLPVASQMLMTKSLVNTTRTDLRSICKSHGLGSNHRHFIVLHVKVQYSALPFDDERDVIVVSIMLYFFHFYLY